MRSSLETRLERCRWAGALWLGLGAACGGAPDPASWVEARVADWPTEDVARLRLEIAAEPAIQGMMLWDSSGERTFPPPGERLFLFEEALEHDLAELEAQRQAPSGWVRVSARSTNYDLCTETRCVRVDGSALAERLGYAPEDHVRLLAPSSPARWPWGLLGLALAAGAFVLRRRHRAPVHPSPPEDPERFAFGPVFICPGRMVVEDLDVARDLNERDLKLLRHFRDRAGFVVAKDELYDVGWGETYFPNSRALDQHILTLRRKLDPERKHPALIETVRGRGYRFPGP